MPFVCVKMSFLITLNVMFQIKRGLQLFGRLTRSNRVTDFLQEWHILRADNVPKGFEKYFEGGKKAAPKQSASSQPKPKGKQLHTYHYL